MANPNTSILNYISKWDNDGVPFNSSEIVKDASGKVMLDTSVSGLKLKLLTMLPESEDVPKNNPGYFSDDNHKNIIIRTNVSSFKGSTVSVTFISEGAGYQNCFGYYVYPLNTNNINIPTKKVNNQWVAMTYEDMMNHTTLKENNVKMILLFANASLPGMGGNLPSGFKMNLIYDVDNRSRIFPNNTGIGFFVIPDGWKKHLGAVKIDITKTSRMVFSDYQFNVVPIPQYFGLNNNLNFGNGARQTILLNDLSSTNGNSASFVLAFEDIMITGPRAGDRDFNDLIVKIDVEPGYSININEIPPLLNVAETTRTAVVYDKSGIYLSLSKSNKTSILNTPTNTYYKFKYCIKLSDSNKSYKLKTVLDKCSFVYNTTITRTNDEINILALIPINSISWTIYLLKVKDRKSVV